jgi:hypothetical protein
MAATGRATVFNASRATPADVDAVLTELGSSAHDWRTPPPELNEEEWAVLYDRTAELTPQKVKRRRASAADKFGATDEDALTASFERWRLPQR